MTIKVDGRTIHLDTPAYIDSQNRTIVPLRFIGEELGYSFAWDPQAKQVAFTGNGALIFLTIGKNEATVNGKKVLLDTAAVTKNGRAMVPLRFILENLGVKVQYNSTTNAVNIVTKDGGEIQTGTRTAVISEEVVNIRSGPDLTYPIVSKANKGNTFKVLTQSNDWYQIEIDSSSTGWVAGWLVTVRSENDAASRSDEPAEGRDIPGTGKTSLKGKTIVIDPGHASIQPGGWSDPGAIGPSHLKEKDVVLDIGLHLNELLKQKGANVIMTRTGDTTLSLGGRAEVANKNKADIFVSIHCNSNTSRTPSGTSTYFFGGVSGQYQARERLAKSVQQELVAAIQRTNLGVLQSAFAVLRYTQVPSILVETAFISNYEEEKLLADPAFRIKAAEGIVRGIERYFSD